MKHLLITVSLLVLLTSSSFSDNLIFWEDPRNICSPNIAAYMSKILQSQSTNAHPPQNQNLHNEFYSKLTRPGTKKSCCNNEDCRPAQHRVKDGHHEFHVGGAWVQVANQQIIDNIYTPDGQSHWCGFDEGTLFPQTFCGIVAPNLF